MSIRKATMLVAFVVLAFAPAGGARSTETAYTDATGDSLTAPDLTALTVSNDAAGAITFKFTIANRPSALNSDDVVGALIDSDRNGATGSPDGAEYFLILSPAGATVAKWDGTNFVTYAHGPVSGSYSAGVGLITFNKTDIGGPAVFDFFAITAAFNSPTDDSDFAPENGVYTYTLTVPPVVVPVTIDSARAVFTPAAPKAGKVFGVSGVNLRLSNKASVKVAPVTCTAKLAGKSLKPVSKCHWKLPANAKGKKLVVTLSVRYKTDSGVVDPYVFKVK